MPIRNIGSHQEPDKCGRVGVNDPIAHGIVNDQVYRQFLNQVCCLALRDGSEYRRDTTNCSLENSFHSYRMVKKEPCPKAELGYFISVFVQGWGWSPFCGCGDLVLPWFGGTVPPCGGYTGLAGAAP